MAETLFIDDDENVDWLHPKQVVFSIEKKGQLVARCNIETREIKTQDSELEEFFYLLVDEGIENGPIGPADGEEFKDLMKRGGYEALPEKATETKDHATPDVYPAELVLEAEDWDFQGLKINIENLAGSVRHGATHHTRLTAPYGYIRDTEGADGDEVDVFVGAVLTAPYAFVIHTKDPKTNKYDEDKVILGVEKASEARKLFQDNYDRPGFFDSMERMSVAQLKSKLKTLRSRKLTRA